MRRVNASTFWRRHGRDISSSSSSRYLFLDFQCPISASSLSKPAVDIATAQPITDADAPVIVFMSVQVLQVSRLRQPKSRSFEIQNHSAPSSVATPSSVRLSAPNSGPLFRRGGGGGSVVFVPGTVWGGVVKVARCRPSMLAVVAVVWAVPRIGPIAVKVALLRDLSRGVVALLLRLRSPMGRVSLLCHSRSELDDP
ncbi:hypothetical protein Tco_1172446 [Tanacetum coccineum]